MRYVREAGGWIGAAGAVLVIFLPAVLFLVTLIAAVLAIIGALIGGDTGEVLNLFQKL